VYGFELKAFGLKMAKQGKYQAKRSRNRVWEPERQESFAQPG